MHSIWQTRNHQVIYRVHFLFDKLGAWHFISLPCSRETSIIQKIAIAARTANAKIAIMDCMETLFEKMAYAKVACSYTWEDEGVVRIGAGHDIAAYACGDFEGKCVIFLHGNGETAISEKYLFAQLNRRGVSVVSPDYRGYGLTKGTFSESGCFEAAHAAYDWLVAEKGVRPEDVIPLGYSLGSGVAVELAASERVGGLILQAPYYSGRALLPHWIKKFGAPSQRQEGFFKRLFTVFARRRDVRAEKSFATDRRLGRISCPALVFHGDADTIIPVSHGKRVFAALASRRKEFARVKYGGHNNFQFMMDYDEYVRKIVAFCAGAKQQDRHRSGARQAWSPHWEAEAR